MLEAKATNLTKSVVDSFKEKFLKGDLKPGQNLPSERDLAQQMNVSRTTVRDAITALRVMGLVEVKQGKRAVITSPSIDTILEPMSLVFPLNESNILSLLEFREVYEPQCVFLATKRVAPNELQKIKFLLDEMERLKSDVQRFAKADFDFHQAIMEATHNEMIVSFTTVFRSLLFNLQIRMALLPEPEAAHIKHERVYEGMLNGDPKKAADLMFELIADTKRRYLKSLS